MQMLFAFGKIEKPCPAPELQFHEITRQRAPHAP